MKNLILLLVLFVTSEAFGVCSSPISRTNNGTNSVLTSTKYNTDLNTVYTKVNNLPGDCIVDDSLSGEKIIDDTVTAEKLASDSVTTVKIANGAVTAAKLAAAIDNLVPTGTILPYGGSTAPTGYLICDGQSISRTTYATLYGVIGNAFGTVDGNSFNVPDLRGKFLRMVDGSAGSDPDKASRTTLKTGGASGNNIGSYQSYQIQSHTHNLANYTGDNNFTRPAFTGSQPSASLVDTGFAGVIAAGGNETRPINVNVNYIIKI